MLRAGRLQIGAALCPAGRGPMGSQPGADSGKAANSVQAAPVRRRTDEERCLPEPDISAARDLGARGCRGDLAHGAPRRAQARTCPERAPFRRRETPDEEGRRRPRCATGGVPLASPHRCRVPLARPTTPVAGCALPALRRESSSDRIRRGAGIEPRTRPRIRKSGSHRTGEIRGRRSAGPGRAVAGPARAGEEG